MVKKLFFAAFLISCNLSVFADTDLDEQIKQKQEIISQLKEEIAQIDSEMARCNKAKNGWVAATVIGGVGVAATGTAAIMQAVESNNKKVQQKKEEQKKEEKK